MMNRTMSPTIRALALAGAALLALPVAAQVYKWTDANGKVHYSNQKPPDAQVQPVKIDAAPPAAPSTAPAATPAPGAAPPANPDSPNADVNAQLAALDQQRCNAAKAVAARYENAPFLQAAGADGKPRKLSVEEEATERLKVKADVERLCKGK